MGSFSSLPPSPYSENTRTKKRSSLFGDDSYYSADMPRSIRKNGTELQNVSQVTDQLSTIDLLGLDSKRLMDSIRDVRALGIEDKDITLPKLCVVGGQSTGKSSLIEGMSEIRVPRSTGTCTRCPLEINLADTGEDKAWGCEVKLVNKYYFDHKRRAGPSHDNRYGPWTEWENPNVISFCSLDDKTQVEEALKWAQLAILNPGSDPMAYRPGFNSQTADGIQVNFSPNVVRLDIVGHGLPCLCFYDLPGVIAIAEDKHSVKLVRNLVKDYIKADNCIILHALTMNTDYQNDVSGSLVKELGIGAQARTVGVLTKPDCVGNSQGSFDQWLDILEGRRYPLRLKYYVVKNSADLTIAHEQAREEEEMFFQTVEPFATKLADHVRYFGTRNLQQALSKELAQQIQRNIPGLMEKLETKLENVKEQLKYLPGPPEGNVSLQVQRNLDRFVEYLSKELNGGSFEHTFFTNWLDMACKFRDQLVDSWPRLLFENLTPRLSPLYRSQIERPCPGGQDAEPITLSDDDGLQSPSRTNKRRLQEGNGTAAQSKRRRQNIIANPFHSQEPTTTDSNSEKIAKKFTFDEIEVLIKGVNKGLPGTRDIKVTENMHWQSIRHWDRLVMQFTESTEQMLKATINQYIELVFEEWVSTAMYQQVTRTTKRFLHQAFEDQRVLFNEKLRDERSKLLTLDRDAKQSHEMEALNVLRTRSRAVMYARAIENAAAQGENTTSQGTQKRLQEGVESQAVVANEQEINEMATARSYYHCASRRFADEIVRSVCTKLFSKCEKDLRVSLGAAIGIDQANANELCSKLLEPDPVLASRRDSLIEKRTKLQQAYERLSELCCDEADD